MGFPLRILMTLKMSRRDKWILAGLFSVTIIAIVTSILRVFFIYAKTGNSTPSPPWLGFWAVVECMVCTWTPYLLTTFSLANSPSYHRWMYTSHLPSLPGIEPLLFAVLQEPQRLPSKTAKLRCSCV